MKIKEVSVQFETVVNLGNYENVRLGCGLIATVEEGEDLEEITRQLYNTAKNEARKAFVAFKESKVNKPVSGPSEAETRIREVVLNEITKDTERKYAGDVSKSEID